MWERRYHGSFFNLVYVNNVASVKLWQKLGFCNVGTVPKAARLSESNGGGYVDAFQFYYDLDSLPSVSEYLASRS